MSATVTVQRLPTQSGGVVFECHQDSDSVWRIGPRRLATVQAGDDLQLHAGLARAYREGVSSDTLSDHVVVHIGNAFGAAPRSIFLRSAPTAAGLGKAPEGGKAVGDRMGGTALNIDEVGRDIDVHVLKELGSNDHYADRSGNTDFSEYNQVRDFEISAGAVDAVGNLIALASALGSWRQMSAKQRMAVLGEAGLRTVAVGADITKMVDSTSKTHHDTAGGIGGTTTLPTGTCYETTASDAASKITGNMADVAGIILSGKQAIEDGKRAWDTWRGAKDKATGERVESSTGEKAEATLQAVASAAELARAAAATARGIEFTITNSYAADAIQAIPILGIIVSGLKLVIRGRYFMKSHLARAKMRHQKRDEKRQLAGLVGLDFDEGDKRNWKLGEVDLAQVTTRVGATLTDAGHKLAEAADVDLSTAAVAEGVRSAAGKVQKGGRGLLRAARAKVRDAQSGLVRLRSKLAEPDQLIEGAGRRIEQAINDLQEIEAPSIDVRKAATSALRDIDEALTAVRGFGRKSLGHDVLHQEVTKKVATLDAAGAADLTIRLLHYDAARELEKINKKREVRAGADITLEFAKIAGDITTLSGVAAGAGMGIKAGASAAGLGMMGTRVAKQGLRDLSARDDAPSFMRRVFSGKTTEEKQADRERLADQIYDRIIAAAAQLKQNSADANAQAELRLVKDQLRAAGLSYKTWSKWTTLDPMRGHKILIDALARRE